MSQEKERLNYTLPYMLSGGLERNIKNLAKNKRQILDALRSVEIPSSERSEVKLWNLQNLEKVAPNSVATFLSEIEDFFAQEQTSGLLGRVGIGTPDLTKADYIKVYLLTTIPPTLPAVLKRAIDAEYLVDLPSKCDDADASVQDYVEHCFFFPETGKRYLARYQENKVDSWVNEIRETLQGKRKSLQRKQKQLNNTIATLRSKLKRKQKAPGKTESQGLKSEAKVTKRLEETEKLEKEIKDTKEKLAEIQDRRQKYKKLIKRLEDIQERSKPRFETVSELSFLPDVDPFDTPLVQSIIAKVVLDVGIGRESISPCLRTWIADQTDVDIAQTRNLLIKCGKFVALPPAEEQWKMVEREVHNEYTLKPWLILGDVDVTSLVEKRRTLAEAIDKREDQVDGLKHEENVGHFLKVQEDFWERLPVSEDVERLSQRHKKIAEKRASSTHPYGVETISLIPEEFDKEFTKAYNAYLQGNPNRETDKYKLEQALYNLWSTKAEIEDLKTRKSAIEDLLEPPNPRLVRKPMKEYPPTERNRKNAECSKEYHSLDSY